MDIILKNGKIISLKDFQKVNKLKERFDNVAIENERLLELDSLNQIKLDSLEKLLLQKSGEAIPAPDKLLNIKQAAEMLSLSVPTIYGLVHRAEIPVSKRGKRLYFSKAELTQWIKDGRKKTNTEIAAEAAQYLTKNKRG